MPPKRGGATATTTRKSTRRGRPSVPRSTVPPTRTTTRTRIPTPTPTPTATPTPTPTTTTSTSTDFSLMFAEHMAASMPSIVAQLKETLLQSMGGSGGGPESGGPEVITRFDGTASGRETSDNDDIVITRADPISSGNQSRGCTFQQFLACKPSEFRGTEDSVATLQWMEQMESVLDVSGCVYEDRVKYATQLFKGKALTWWNSVIKIQGRVTTSVMTWEHLKRMVREVFVPASDTQRLEQELWDLTMQGSDVRGYTDRFYDLMVLAPRLVKTEQEKITKYVDGLPLSMRDNIIPTRPGTLRSAVEIAYTLTESMIRGGALQRTVVRKDDSGRHGRRSRPDSRKRSRGQDQSPQPSQSYVAVGSSQGKRPKCGKCGGGHAPEVACWKCERCKKLGHTERFCTQIPGTCYECGEKGHYRNRCPKFATTTPLFTASTSGGGDTARGRVFSLGSTEARQDPTVVTGI